MHLPPAPVCLLFLYHLLYTHIIPYLFLWAALNEEDHEDTELQKSWWENNKCGCASLLLLLLIIDGMVRLVLVVGLLRDDDDDDGTNASSAASGTTVASVGNGTRNPTPCPVAYIASDRGPTPYPAALLSHLSNPTPVGSGEGPDVALIALVIDRSCEYRKNDTVDVSVIGNGANNG